MHFISALQISSTRRGQIYISEYTELLLSSETFTIPKEITEATEELLSNLMSFEAIQRSPVKKTCVIQRKGDES